MSVLSKKAGEELQDKVLSRVLRADLDAVAGSRINPFIKDGRVDVDAYIAFVSEFNEFINHQPKPFEPIKDADMRL
jgi:hypothetical protein